MQSLFRHRMDRTCPLTKSVLQPGRSLASVPVSDAAFLHVPLDATGALPALNRQSPHAKPTPLLLDFSSKPPRLVVVHHHNSPVGGTPPDLVLIKGHFTAGFRPGGCVCWIHHVPSSPMEKKNVLQGDLTHHDGALDMGHSLRYGLMLKRSSDLAALVLAPPFLFTLQLHSLLSSSYRQASFFLLGC